MFRQNIAIKFRLEKNFFPQHQFIKLKQYATTLKYDLNHCDNGRFYHCHVDNANYVLNACKSDNAIIACTFPILFLKSEKKMDAFTSYSSDYDDLLKINASSYLLCIQPYRSTKLVDSSHKVTDFCEENVCLTCSGVQVGINEHKYFDNHISYYLMFRAYNRQQFSTIINSSDISSADLFRILGHRHTAKRGRLAVKKCI